MNSGSKVVATWQRDPSFSHGVSRKGGVALSRRSTFPGWNVWKLRPGAAASTLKIFSSLKQITSRFRRRLGEISRARRPPRSKRQPRQHLLSELATITDVTVLQMEHCADHQRTQAQQTDGFSWTGTRQCEAIWHGFHWNSPMFLLNEFVDLVEEIWRQTPWAPTDITWRRVSSLDCSNTLTNTAAWHPRSLAMEPADLPDDTSLSRVSKSSDNHELPRPIPLLTNKDSIGRIHWCTKEDTNTCETDPDVYVNAVICGVFGQCRCQSAWMAGATLCSWLFVCECAYVHLLHTIPTIWTFMIKTQMRFSQKRLYGHALRAKTPQTRAKNFQLRKKLCGSKRWKSGPTYLSDPWRNNATSFFQSQSPYLAWDSQLDAKKKRAKGITVRTCPYKNVPGVEPNHRNATRLTMMTKVRGAKS